MFNLMTDRARKVMGLARLAAEEFRHDYIGPEHILLGLVQGTGRAVDALKELQVHPERIREGVEELVPGSRTPTPARPPTPEQLAAARQRFERHGGRLQPMAREAFEEIMQKINSGEGMKQIPFTPDAKTVLEKTQEEAAVLGDNHIGTEHLLLGLLRGSDAIAARVLRKERICLVEVRRIARAISKDDEADGRGG